MAVLGMQPKAYLAKASTPGEFGWGVGLVLRAHALRQRAGDNTECPLRTSLLLCRAFRAVEEALRGMAMFFRLFMNVKETEQVIFTADSFHCTGGPSTSRGTSKEVEPKGSFYCTFQCSYQRMIKGLPVAKCIRAPR